MRIQKRTANSTDHNKTCRRTPKIVEIVYQILQRCTSTALLRPNQSNIKNSFQIEILSHLVNLYLYCNKYRKIKNIAMLDFSNIVQSQFDPKQMKIPQTFLIVYLLQTCVSFFLLMNTKVDILKNVGGKTAMDLHSIFLFVCLYYGFQWLKKWLEPCE